DFPRGNLLPASWDPAKFFQALASLPGVAGAERVGLDAMTPSTAQLLRLACPRATVEDGEEAMRAARAIKTPDEIECLRIAAAIAEACLETAVAAVRPGARERELLAAFEGRMGDFGIQTPALEGVFCATPRDGDPAAPPFRQLIGDGAVDSGDLVAL